MEFLRNLGNLTSRGAIAALLLLSALCCFGGALRASIAVAGPLTGSPLLTAVAHAVPWVCICAAVLVLCGNHWGYRLGILSGLLALPLIIWSETRFGESTWVFFNATGRVAAENAKFEEAAQGAMLRIASVALIVTAAVVSLLRLLPSRWPAGRLPLCERTWPAVAVALVTMATWFAHSAYPYRLPVIVDAVPAELRILYVEKRSLLFRETAASVYRDGRFVIRRTERPLFRFAWKTHGVAGQTGQPLLDRVRALVGSPQAAAMSTGPARQLWSWNAEGWYVVLKDRRLGLFTGDDQTESAIAIRDLLREIEQLPWRQQTSWETRDICLGLCYGPAAALGFEYSNEPCFALALGATQCR